MKTLLFRFVIGILHHFSIILCRTRIMRERARERVRGRGGQETRLLVINLRVIFISFNFVRVYYSLGTQLSAVD